MGTGPTLAISPRESTGSDRVRTDAVRQFDDRPGRSALPPTRSPSAGEVLTGDLNLLRIQATVQYRVADPVAHAPASDQVEPLLTRAAEASLTRSLARRGVDAVLRSDRGRIAAGGPATNCKPSPTGCASA